MNKRGQIYILAAIIIGFLLFTIISPINFVHKKITDDDFEELSQNFKTESSKFLNEILNKEYRTPPDLEEYFLNFTVLFTSYSKTKNPNFGLIYAFPYQGKLLIGNYLDRSIDFTPGGNLQGCFDDVDASISISGLDLYFPNIDLSLYKKCITKVTYPYDNNLNFTIEQVPYSFKLTKDTPDVIVVSRESLGEDIKVFIS